MTLLGAVFIPIALFCLMSMPQFLLPLLVISSIFQAGSVFNGAVGSFAFGLPPFYFVASCIALRYLFLTISGWKQRKLESRRARKVRILLVAFCAWSVASALVMPRIFDGMPVYNPREGIDEQFLLQTPLHWGLSNLAQALFLILDVVVVLYALRTVRSERQRTSLAKS